MVDIHLVSHTHWDREWYLTYEQFRLRLVGLVDRLLDLLDDDPGYAYFHLDGQTIVLEDYLELRPDQEERLRRAVASGRVLVGPWYDMPDEFLVSGESLVRNLARGHRIARRYGEPMPVGYLPDLFGHVGQMPQIWRLFGIDNTILWRGFGGRHAEYWWEAPDGSRVLMLHLPPEGYCNATRALLDPEMPHRATKAIERERGRTRVGQVLLMNGVDHVEPQPAVSTLVEQLSEMPGVQAAQSTLPAYVTSVKRAMSQQAVELESIHGELRSGTDYANLLPGVLSARVYLKQANARVQAQLEAYAEPLSVFATMGVRGFGRVPFRYPAGELDYAWKLLLQNHPHDSICGCSIDAVHEENMTRFAKAEQVAEALIEEALQSIADGIEPPGASTVRVVVVNTDAHPRAGVIEARIDLPVDSAEPWRHVDAAALDRPVTFWPTDASIAAVTGHDGVSLPFQLLGETRLVSHVLSRLETPWALNVRRLHVLLWAPAVPAFGYTSFDVEIGTARATSTAPEVPTVSAGADVIEHDRLRVTAEADGTFTVIDKATGVCHRGVASFEDSGDVGDEYNYCPPATDRRITNADARVVGRKVVAAGQLRATIAVELELSIPERASIDRASRTDATVTMPIRVEASLDAGSPRVAFRVSLENRASDHRLRLLFPVGVSRVDAVRADTAFDVVTRPPAQPRPAVIRNEAPVNSAPLITLVDAGDEKTGATVVSQGLMEYELVEQPPAIAMTLVRAVGDLSRNDLATRPSGHAGPPIATPGAQCHGSHRFEIAFEPRPTPTAQSGALFASSRAYNVPPRTAIACDPRGAGARERSFLRVELRAGQPVLSALKQADDRRSVVVRMFNPEDETARVAVGLVATVAPAFALNLLEERQRELREHDGLTAVEMRPHEIATIELVR